jgi:hypothetical protein
MKKTIVLATVLALVLTIFQGCGKFAGIDGNHNVEKETRKLVSFKGVINEGSFNIFISNDSVSEVTVEAESNIIPFIRTVVNDNKLIIDTKKGSNINVHYPVNVYVKSPLVKYVAMEGSGNMMFDSLTCKAFIAEMGGSGNIGGKVIADNVFAGIKGSGNISLVTNCTEIVTRIDGSGNIGLRGSSDTANHEIRGSGSLNAFEFINRNCKSAISGSGDMNLNVTAKLDVNISGSGHVYYTGNPQINVVIKGSGSVIKH